MPFLEIKDGTGFRMHYEIVSNCLPVDTLFIHGNIASNLWWYPLRDELISRRDSALTGKMIIAEFRGCGQSVLENHPEINNEIENKTELNQEEESEKKSNLDPGFGFERLVQDFEDLILELKKQKIILSSTAIVGHSTGGLIAGLLLAQAPVLFSRALLLDPVGMRGMKFSAEILKRFNRVSFDKKFREDVFAAVIPKKYLQQPDFYNNFILQSLRSIDQIGKTIVHWMENVNYTEKFLQIKSPTLVVHGGKDIILPINDSKEMVATIPGAQFYCAENFGHSMNAEDPAAFADLLLNFLTTN